MEITYFYGGTKMDSQILTALELFINTANCFLNRRIIAAYSFGSAIYDDFHTGYSDLDFFIISDGELSIHDFDRFHKLREEYKNSDNPYLSVLEGEIISYCAIKNDKKSNVIYWGTSKDRFNTKYGLSGFSMRGLLNNGYLIYGRDVRNEMPYPSEEEMLEQVVSLIKTIRKYAVTVSQNIHSVDWLFLIAQSIYWIKTGGTTGKTDSARWLVDNCHYQWNDLLKPAIEIRQHPELSTAEDRTMWLKNLGGDIQIACNSLEQEIKRYHVK